MHTLKSPLFDSHDALVWMIVREHTNTPPQELQVKAGIATKSSRWARMTHQEIADIALSSPARVKKSLLKLEQGGVLEALESIALDRANRYRVLT